MNKSVIIIGAGAAGLMAAKYLSAAGFNVTILEAANRIGGRIHSFTGDGFTNTIELGAEFIHGNLPVTLGLLKEANISYVATGGRRIKLQHGKLEASNAWNNWDELLHAMQQLKEDMTVARFLETYFAGSKYETLRKSVTGFAEGYDLADIQTASVFALRDEWMKEDEPQYRIPTGYTSLMVYLLQCSVANAATIHYNSFVQTISWNASSVEVITTSGQIFSASYLIITVSLGMLLSGKMKFTPEIPTHLHAAGNIGFGTATKIFFQFDHALWNNYAPDAGFIMADEFVNVWWTQAPDSYPMLTGWLGATKAIQLATQPDAQAMTSALNCLSGMFNVEISKLEKIIVASKISDWSKDPFALGGYSFNTTQSANAKQILHTVVGNKIFFAGEACYDGAVVGTVEAALISGQTAAENILKRTL